MALSILRARSQVRGNSGLIDFMINVDKPGRKASLLRIDSSVEKMRFTAGLRVDVWSLSDAPAAGSIDDHLEDLEETLTNIEEGATAEPEYSNLKKQVIHLTSFETQKPFSPGVSAYDIMKRLAGRGRTGTTTNKNSNLLPFARAPQFAIEKDPLDSNLVRLIINLPPQTYLSFDNTTFWGALGFPDVPDLESKLGNSPGYSNFSFVPNSVAGAYIDGTRTLLETAVRNYRLELGKKPKESDLDIYVKVLETYKTVTTTVGFLHGGVTSPYSVKDYATDRPEAFMAHFSKALEECMASINLKGHLLQISGANSEREFTVESSRAGPEGQRYQKKLVYTIVMDKPLAQALGLTNHKQVFDPLAACGEKKFTIAGDSSDPLKGDYPLAVICHTHRTSDDDDVEGGGREGLYMSSNMSSLNQQERSRQNLFAWARNPDNIRSNTIDLKTSVTQLGLELRTRRDTALELPAGADIILTLLIE